MRAVVKFSWAVALAVVAAGCSSTDMKGGGPVEMVGDDAGTTEVIVDDAGNEIPVVVDSSVPNQPQPDSSVPNMTTNRPVGDPCTAMGQCSGAANAVCIGWTAGYCSISGCTDGTCPSGSECFEMADASTRCLKNCTTRNDCRAGYACHSLGACVPACTATSCDAGEVCRADGLCGAPACTPTSCPANTMCAANGECVVTQVGAPPVGPGPACANLPVRDCTTNCTTISAFSPDMGAGYHDYELNGETAANMYRSYANQTLQMLVKYAAAYTACKTAGWAGGTGMPLALGDMSEANGAIPGTSIGQPGHPAGTHVNGRDMDIGYFQASGPNNFLRPVCPYTSGGQDQNHCVGEPNNLDIWRTAMVIGSMLASPKTRVIGVDGKVGPHIKSAIMSLCANQWLPAAACTAVNSKMVYEVTDMGLGWYYFHHHHFHVSTN